MKWLISFLSILVTSNQVFAHPVSYKDAWGIMPTIMAGRQDLELNYSFAADKAAGLSLMRIENSQNDYQFIIPRYNYRLYRRNQLDSQLNFYLNSGVGAEVHANPGGVLFAGLQADYETRRFYTLFSSEYLENMNGKDFWSSRYRLGVAPYLADFESVHTWLIAQADYNPQIMDGVMLSPVLRFFYKNYLLEVGSSLDGQFFMAGIFHF